MRNFELLLIACAILILSACDTKDSFKVSATWHDADVVVTAHNEQPVFELAAGETKTGYIHLHYNKVTTSGSLRELGLVDSGLAVEVDMYDGFKNHIPGLSGGPSINAVEESPGIYKVSITADASPASMAYIEVRSIGDIYFEGEKEKADHATARCLVISHTDSAPHLTSIEDQSFALRADDRWNDSEGNPQPANTYVYFAAYDKTISFENLIFSATSDNTSLIEVDADSFWFTTGPGSELSKTDPADQPVRALALRAKDGQTGTANITVTVDNGSEQSTETFKFTLDPVAAGNAAPTAVITVTDERLIVADETFWSVELNLASSTDDVGIVNYKIDWGDGSPIESQAGSSFTHGYTSDGTYTITATVTDAGALTNSTTTSITAAVSPL